MKIYTKTGDKGYTGLLGGTRVPKSSDRINAYGTIDELNSYIGLLSAMPVNSERKETLNTIQNYLFTIGSHLAADKEIKGMPALHSEEPELLEKAIDEMEKELPVLKTFILPGGNMEVSFCHIARTVARRAEREVVGLTQKNEAVNETIIVYLNRLSDFLFVLARKMGQDMGAGEIPWIGREQK
jgi:cob(I)alamin adenosyltransferase